MGSMKSTTHRGGCHCGAVRFEVKGALRRVLDCNCSICSKVGFLHWIVPRADFALLRGGAALTTYTFGTHVARHTFCGRCGVKAFYTPRSHPDSVSVNARCLDGVELAALEVQPFDGRNWEESVRAIR